MGSIATVQCCFVHLCVLANVVQLSTADGKNLAGFGEPTRLVTSAIKTMRYDDCMVWLDDRSADVWAFGVLLWEMFSGQRAWAGMSYTQVMQAVGYEQRGPEWPASAPPALAVSALQVPLASSPGAARKTWESRGGGGR